MYDIKNMNIWKAEEHKPELSSEFHKVEITELNLSVRSYNCLKRAGCNTIGDILALMDEEGQGLRRIRNLGSRSEQEIIERVGQLRDEYKNHPSASPEGPGRKVIRPAKKIWDRRIDEFCLSNYALTKLNSCGIYKVEDLYATNPKNEPGWYAVRELFDKIGRTV